MTLDEDVNTWQAMTDEPYNISKVKLLNANEISQYLQGAMILIDQQICGTVDEVFVGNWSTINCRSGPIKGRQIQIVRTHLKSKNLEAQQPLAFCGIEVWGTYAGSDKSLME